MQTLYRKKYDEYWVSWVKVKPSELTGKWMLRYNPFEKKWHMYIGVRLFLFFNYWEHEDHFSLVEDYPEYVGECNETLPLL